jgi:hypothetical protein
MQMTRTISATAVAALLGFGALSSIAPPADAASPSNVQQQDQYIRRFCDKYRGADQCNDWRANHPTWTSDRYLNFYRRHQNDKDFATPAATKLFGFPPDQK